MVQDNQTPEIKSYKQTLSVGISQEDQRRHAQLFQEETDKDKENQRNANIEGIAFEGQ